MYRKLIFLISIVLVLGLVNSASAAIITWTNDAPDSNSWCDKDNWLAGTENEVPGSSDTAVIATPERGPIIGIGCDVDVAIIHGPMYEADTNQVMDVNTDGTVRVRTGWEWDEGSGTATININGSPTITIGGEWRAPDNGTSILNISGDPNIIVEGDLRGADGAGTFYINMSGGRLEVQGEGKPGMCYGDNGGGELNLSGGSLIIAEHLLLGGERGTAPVTVNMTGGSMSVGAHFMLPSAASRAGVVKVNLDAGVIDCNEFVHGEPEKGGFTDDWRLDIEQGTLKIRGDVTDAIDANVAAGQITAYDGDGTVNVELVDGNTVVTGLPPDPNTATKPNPAIGSKQVEPDVVVSWTSGINAAEPNGHDVYFGTDFDDVNEGTGGTFMGNQDSNTFNIHDYDPCGLEFETTYYWRIDEVNDSNTWTGRVWFFTTRGPISDPNLLIWYKLDEPNGNIAYDSSGHGNHGPVDVDEDEPAAWDPDGRFDGCLIFNASGEDDTVVQPPSTALMNIDKGITFSVWLKDPYKMGDDNWVFDAGGAEGAPHHVWAFVPDENGDVEWRAGDDTNDVCVWTTANYAEWIGYWRHFAFVKDENSGKMLIYYEGKPIAERTGVSVDTLAGVRNKAFKIGVSAWGNYDYVGAMDDFRVYDRALSAVEIASLFRGGDLGIAWSPDPTNGAKDVSRDVVLTWKPGNYVQDVNAHDVYFGTSWNDANDANTTETLDVYKGPQNLDANSYTPPTLLDLDTTYYWRIDEVNDANLDSPWKGDVWTLTVANFLIVDNMEDYNDIPPDRIYDTWHDWSQYDPVGGKYPTSAEITIETADANVHGGKQSMKFQYNNSDSGAWMFYRNISEIDANTIGPLMHLEIGQDWTILDMKVLTLYFIGLPDNDANEQMYVVLADSAGRTAVVPYGYYIDEDMNDIKKREWTEWNILLEDFNDINDVDLTDVNNVYIGFGNREDPTVGGAGVVFFDDIRLYPRKCVASRRKPDFDWSDNCIVDFEDIEIMGDHWLRRDANFLPVVNPGTTGLVAHWKLDGNANDSQGTNNGTVEGSYSWVTGHIDTGALEFSGDGGRVLVPDAAVLRPEYTVSASAWVYYPATQPTSARIVVKGQNNFETYALEVGNEDTLTFNMRDVNGVQYAIEKGNVWPNEWVHLAGTYDGSVIKSYVNGRVVDSNDGYPGIALSQDTTGLGIGNRSDDLDRAFIGTIDDVRVYNRALSADEVEWLASKGTGYVALTSEANIYTDDEGEPGSKKVNFRDYAKLVDNWLEEKLYPPEP